MSSPAEQVAEGMQRAVPTPFLTKTYQIVDDPTNNDVISWNAGGAAFIVWRPGDFARDVLPRRFKHNNLSSFVRQLNTYGFKKISPDRWEFAHELFRRGEQQLLCRIERRKVTLVVAPADRAASPASSGDEQVRSTGSSLDPEEHLTASSSHMAELIEENDQLRRENKRLASEHAELKNLCSTIRRMMLDYASGSQQQSSEGATAAVASPLLERMDGDGAEDEQRNGDGGESSMLFGVQIGSKRSREEEEELQLMPPEVRTTSEGSICNPQVDEDLVRLSLSQVSNRRACSDSNRYFHPARSDT